MASTGPPSPTRPVLPAVTLCAIGAALLLALWVRGRDQPELLIEPAPLNVSLRFEQGSLNWWLNEPGSVSHYALLPREHRARLLVRVTCGVGDSRALKPDEDAALCALVHPRLAGMVFGTGGRSKPSLGIFATSTKLAVGRGEKRRELGHLHTPTVREQPTRFVLFPSGGGPPRQVTVDLGGYSPTYVNWVYADGAVYWTPPYQQGGYSVETDRATWMEMPVTGRVLRSPVGGGRQTEVAKGLASPRIHRSQHYVWWRSARAYPDSAADWYYLRPRDGKRGTLLGIRPQSQVMDAGAPLECGGRFYWLEGLSPVQGDSRIEPRLVCCDGNGGGRRTLVRFADHGLKPFKLGCDGRHVYVLYATTQRDDAGDPSYYGTTYDRDEYVARVDETAPDPLARTRKLPPGSVAGTACFGNGNLYFVRNETRRSALDWLSATDTERTVTGIYRMRLPD